MGGRNVRFYLSVGFLWMALTLFVTSGILAMRKAVVVLPKDTTSMWAVYERLP